MYCIILGPRYLAVEALKPTYSLQPVPSWFDCIDTHEDHDIESFKTTICFMFLNIAFEINMYKVRVKVYVKDTGRAEFVTRNL